MSFWRFFGSNYVQVGCWAAIDVACGDCIAEKFFKPGSAFSSNAKRTTSLYAAYGDQNIGTLNFVDRNRS